MKNKTGIIRKCFAVLVLLLVLVFFLSVGLYISEINSEHESFSSIWDAMQFVFITLTTVGYEDGVYPMTFGGKLFTMLTAAIGSIIGVACLIWIVLGIIRLGSYLRKI